MLSVWETELCRVTTSATWNLWRQYKDILGWHSDNGGTELVHISWTLNVSKYEKIPSLDSFWWTVIAQPTMCHLLQHTWLNTMGTERCPGLPSLLIWNALQMFGAIWNWSRNGVLQLIALWRAICKMSGVSYPCCFVRSRKVSKPRDWYFKLSHRFEIWQAHRQHCCRSACQISERSDNSKYKSRGVETSRDLTIIRLIGYWNGAQYPRGTEQMLSMWP